MIERLDFSADTSYSAAEAAIHLNRYSIAKPYIAGKKVLDVASGDGYGSFLLKKWGAAEVHALDIDSKTIEKAVKTFGSETVHFTCHTAEDLPYEDYSFDVICSFETIEHLDCPEQFLSEIRRVLKPGGTIIISCPNDPYYHKNGSPNNPFHKRAYTFPDFKSATEKYLGTDVKYLLAFALNGFANIPIEYQTMPPEADSVDPLPKDMFALFNYKNAIGAMVAGERYLNHWNASYYVGIWHSVDFPSVNTVVYPHETFTDYSKEEIEQYLASTGVKQNLRDTILQLQQEVDVLKDSKDALEKSMQEELLSLRNSSHTSELKLQEELDTLKSNKHVLELEIERLSLSLELEAKEKEIAYSQVRDLYDSNQSLKDELSQIKQSMNNTSLELQRTSLMMELENKTGVPYQIALSRRQLLKELIKTSRLFNFARRFRVVKWLVWHIFKRQI